MNRDVDWFTRKIVLSIFPNKPSIWYESQTDFIIYIEMQEKAVNKSLVLVLVMITSFITPFIGASVNLALPKISEDFGLNAIGMSWVAMSYLLSSAVFLVPMGKLADIVGRKRIFFWGNIILVISSFLCALSPSGALLITFRVIQGLGS